jgi:hypothetical protein
MPSAVAKKLGGSKTLFLPRFVKDSICSIIFAPFTFFFVHQSKNASPEKGSHF